MRLTIPLLIAIATVAHAAPAAAANARQQPCTLLRLDAVEHAIDYALEASTQGELASAPDLTVDIAVNHCHALSRRSAQFQYELKITDEHKIQVAGERGRVIVTPRRGTFIPNPGPWKGR